MQKRRNVRNAENNGKYNRNKCLHLLRKRPMARVELANELGLTRPALSLIADELIAQGLIRETSSIDSKRGRPKIQLEICPDVAYFLGIYLKREYYRIGLFDFANHELFSTSGKILEGETDETINLITQSVQFLLDHSGISKDKLLGAGISSPGPIDSEKGIILAPNFKTMGNIHLCQILSEKLGIPVYLEKDTTCLANYCAENGEAGKSSDFVVLLVRNGIGFGVVNNGKTFGSNNGFSLELGHCTINYSGKPCICGNIGCLEAYASLEALLLNSSFHSWREIQNNLLLNQEAEDLFQREVEYLTAGLTNAVNLIRFDTVLLAVGFETDLEALTNEIEVRLNQRQILHQFNHITVKTLNASPNYMSASASSIATNRFIDNNLYPI